MKASLGLVLAVLAVGAAAWTLWPDGDGAPAPPPSTAPAADPPVTVYRTDPGLEPDTCVAAWLLTRIVSPQAGVVVGREVPEAVAFDTPDSPLRRQAGKSASRTIVERFAIDDAFALAAADVAQELEIAPWTLKDDPFFVRLRGGLGEALNASESDQECLELALAFMDRLMADYPAREDLPENNVP